MTTIETITAEQTRPLRHLVLWPHIAELNRCITDTDFDPGALHLGAFTNRQLLGVCSLFATASPKLPHSRQYRLRAMATHPRVRGMGLGRLLVLEAIRRAGEFEADVLWCDAREVAIGFYQKLGFERIDDWYEVPHIGPHQFMYHELR
jgi:ribosomal protein S18 acetylase RimI-like enzyme